jgi:Na+/melibiose symporter-like transporter
VHAAAGSQAIGGEKLLARFGQAFAHRPFRIVFAASTSQLFGFGTAGASAIYYVVYVSHLPLSAFSGYIVAACAGAAIAQPLWVALAARIGNLTTYRVALFSHTIPALLFLLMPPGAPYIFYLIGFISGTTTMGSTLLSFAMLVEVIALDGPDSTRKGLFAAIYTAMEKVMIACGGFCVAIILSLAHFSASTAPLAQPPAVHVAILVAFIGVQVATLLFSLVLLARYSPAATVAAAAA